MGARQSYLYIYLKKKDKEYDEAGCKVKCTKTVVNGAIDFELVTYTINYNGNTPTNFDIYIYETEEKVYNAPYLFAYCSPSKNQVADEVRVYYSVLSPSKPLVISFVTKSTEPYNCDIDKLRNARWNWAAYITEYTFKDDLVTKLKEQYKKLLRNRTIEFVEGGKDTKDVMGYQQELDDKTHYRIIYTPGADYSVLNSNCLFTFNTKYEGKYKDPKIQTGCKKPAEGGTKNQIDSYYLTSVKGHFFDGILVYFARDEEKKENKSDEHHDKSTALYLEFIDLRNKDICLQRKDKAGCFWAEEKIEYDNDTKLLEALKKINEGIKDDVNTVILDNKNGYNGVKVKPEEGKTVFKKYTYTFDKANKPNLLFDRKTITTDPLKSVDTKAKDVDAYYLKVKDYEDKEPFLIVFNQNGEDEQKKEKKAYYFGDKYNFENWKEFNSGKPEEVEKKLSEKLKEIEDNLNCVYDLKLVRLMGYQFFIGEKPKPPEVKETTTPTRPPLETPDPTTGPPNLWLIIGCSVGGFLLLVALVVGYGIYWYNTTIKLLT